VEQRELGRSGIVVSHVILGCGNFGGVGSAPAFFGRGVPKEEAFRIMDAAWDVGITTFDTADAYGGGRSETWIGDWLATKDSRVRDAIVLETKTFNPNEEGGDRGLARERILRQIDRSLFRLGVERVDLYLAHEFDPEVAQDETLGAFDELFRAGKVGAVGASNFSAEQVTSALEISDRAGIVRYEWLQRSYSLLAREDEDDILPLCRAHGLGYEAYGPLAGGWLTGKYRRGAAYPEGSRMTQRPESYLAYGRDDVFDALDAFEREAFARGVSMACLATAWLLGAPDVAAVVIGPTRIEHLEPVREALSLELTTDDRDHLRGLFP
jgi:aryl-alcohol dehydrogenase-like predicted oxidoreductase